MASQQNMARALRPDEIELLARFLRCDIRMEELEGHFEDVLSFDFEAKVRKLDQHFLTLEPGIRVEPEHIDHAVQLRTGGTFSASELERWATFLLLCDAYAWENEAISERLHELSMPEIG